MFDRGARKRVRRLERRAGIWLDEAREGAQRLGVEAREQAQRLGARLREAGERAAGALRPAGRADRGEPDGDSRRGSGAGSRRALRAGASAAAGPAATALARVARRRGRRGARLLVAAGAAAGAWAIARRVRDARLPSWSGRVALVTGGTRGLGLWIARELAAEGCRLVICARDDAELARAARDLRERGAEVLALRCDVTSEEEVAAMVAHALERFGRVDVLVNNAGTIDVGPVEHARLEDFRRAHRVICEGALHCTLALLPHFLARQSGHLINVSSLGGRIALPHLLPYDTAKFALQGLSEGLRAELAPRGICVTTLVPGTLRTGSFWNARFKGQRTRELVWFALGSSLPGLSMSARRAARAAVRGARRGQAEVVVPGYAKVLTRLHGVAPATASAVAARVARALPAPSATDGEALEGRWVADELSPRQRRWLERGTVLGRRAGRDALQPDAGEGPSLAERAGPVARRVGGGILLLAGIRRGGLLGLAAGACGAVLLGQEAPPLSRAQRARQALTALVPRGGAR